MKVKIMKNHSSDQIYANIINQIEQIIKELRGQKDILIGLSGSSMVQGLSVEFNKRPSSSDLFKIPTYFLCDERLVSIDNPESTYGCYKKQIDSFDKLNFIRLDNPNKTSPESNAKEYEEKLKNRIDTSFVILLLGMGPDGHTASLFPKSKTLCSDNIFTFESNSPKPPPERITITLKWINKANLVYVVACGSSKGALIDNVLSGRAEDLPINLIRPQELIWAIDEPATTTMAKETLERLRIN